MEPLKHIRIRSTVPCSEAVLISEVNLHLESLNKGHIGIRSMSLVVRLSLSQRLTYVWNSE